MMAAVSLVQSRHIAHAVRKSSRIVGPPLISRTFDSKNWSSFVYTAACRRSCTELINMGMSGYSLLTPERVTTLEPHIHAYVHANTCGRSRHGGGGSCRIHKTLNGPAGPAPFSSPHQVLASGGSSADYESAESLLCHISKMVSKLPSYID